MSDLNQKAQKWVQHLPANPKGKIRLGRYYRGLEEIIKMYLERMLQQTLVKAVVSI
jgi:hypothetical protein